MIITLAGLQWGDEGKGKIADLLSHHADLVIGSKEEITQDILSNTKRKNLSCTTSLLEYVNQNAEFCWVVEWSLIYQNYAKK